MTKIQRPGSPPPPPAPTRSNNRNNKKVVVHRGGNSRPKNKTAPSSPTDDTQDQGDGYYDPSLIGPGNGDLFDPNNPYGRTPTNPDIPDFKTWAQQQGYNLHNIHGQKRQR